MTAFPNGPYRIGQPAYGAELLGVCGRVGRPSFMVAGRRCDDVDCVARRPNARGGVGRATGSPPAPNVRLRIITPYFKRGYDIQRRGKSACQRAYHHYQALNCPYS